MAAEKRRTAREQIVDGGACDDELAFQRLLLTGLIDGDPAGMSVFEINFTPVT